MWAWGAGTSGQLGNGLLEDQLSPKLVELPVAITGEKRIQIACGGSFAVLTAGMRGSAPVGGATHHACMGVHT